MLTLLWDGSKFLVPAESRETFGGAEYLVPSDDLAEESPQALLRGMEAGTVSVGVRADKNGASYGVLVRREVMSLEAFKGVVFELPPKKG